jgi:hypothetical protein
VAVDGGTNTRLVQLQQGAVRRVARVEEPSLRLLAGAESVLMLASEAISRGQTLTGIVEQHATSELIDYDPVYSGRSPWRLLVPIDHPEPARCLVSGTGLTHFGSAASRNTMHAASATERGASLTDSMRMFRSGLEGGRPEAGRCGTAPEWFYKGDGRVLRAMGEELVVPPYADDGGEEAEIAGVYVIGPDGRPWRVGMAAGNEFSDHKYEKQNYLHLAGSKLRTCALGPELAVDPDFGFVGGRVAIERRGRAIWEREVATGEREMCHSLANIEDHHFKYEGHRRPGDVHVHYYGAHSLSFSDAVVLEAGDVMTIQFEGFGRPLRNAIKISTARTEPVIVQPLT